MTTPPTKSSGQTLLRLVPAVVASILAPLGAGACRGTPEERTVPFLIRHARFEDALDVAREEAERNPRSRQAEANLASAEVALLLDRGRDALFAGFPEEALELFHRAFEIDPGSPTVATWIVKTRDQLAQESLDDAHERVNKDQLPEALEAYERALAYDPDHEEAVRGASRVLLLMNYRSGLSKSYYDDGLRSFRRLMLKPAARSFGIAADLDPGSDRSRRQQREVERMLAEERLAQARELEALELYFAARNEYRLALLADGENAEAREGFDRMDREVRAARRLEKAEMGIRRGEVEKAVPLLEEAARLTEAQQEDITLREAMIEEARLRELYENAVALERDFLYPDALRAYDKLLTEAEFFEDAIARRNTVAWFIEEAEKRYAEAIEAESDVEAYRLFREIHELLWPSYRDVEERLALLALKVETADDVLPKGGRKRGSGGKEGQREGRKP